MNQLSRPDGLPEVFVEHSPELPLVSFSVSLRTGAITDPDGKDGLTRLTGRLMRRTAGGRDPQSLDRTIDGLGAALGVDTSHSTSGLQGTVIVRSLDAFVDLIVDTVAKPGFSADELSRLVRETKAEIVDNRDNDRAVARHWFRRKFLEGHPYGRSALGRTATVDSVTESDVRSHHARTWVRDNLVFAFSGDLDAERANAIATRISDALPRGAPIVDDTPEPSRPQGRYLLFVDKPERTQTQILIGCLGSHPADDDHVALHVANTVFGGTFTARMTREIRSKRGWSYGAYSSLPYDRRRRAFTMWTFPKATDAAPCIRLELELLEKFWNKGITARELSWAKRYLVRSHCFAVDTASKRVGMSLDARLYDLPAGYYETYLDRVKAVTLEEANAAIQRRLSIKDLLVTVVGTEAEIGVDVRKAIDGLANVDVVAFDAE